MIAEVSSLKSCSIILKTFQPTHCQTFINMAGPISINSEGRACCYGRGLVVRKTKNDRYEPMRCYQLSQLEVKKSDWPDLNVTDRTFIH